MSDKNIAHQLKRVSDIVLNQDMSRREFLMFLAGIIVSISGIKSLLGSVIKYDKNQPGGVLGSSANNSHARYGGGTYGGSVRGR